MPSRRLGPGPLDSRGATPQVVKRDEGAESDGVLSCAFSGALRPPRQCGRLASSAPAAPISPRETRALSGLTAPISPWGGLATGCSAGGHLDVSFMIGVALSSTPSVAGRRTRSLTVPHSSCAVGMAGVAPRAGGARPTVKVCDHWVLAPRGSGRACRPESP